MRNDVPDKAEFLVFKALPLVEAYQFILEEEDGWSSEADAWISEAQAYLEERNEVPDD